MPSSSPYRFFQRGTWSERVSGWLDSQEGGEEREFLDANEAAVRRWVAHADSGVRMVVNVPADGLLGFLATGRYLNAYEHPVVAGDQRGPSKQRQAVDALVGLNPPRDFYFGAVALGGTGVRFYGEYCLVLAPGSVDDGTQVLDRNSYDLLQPPFSTREGSEMAALLRGEWAADLIDMIVLKALPGLRDFRRLITLGVVSDSVLHDEDFMEVHRRGTFGPDDVEEVREAPEDQAVESHIRGRMEGGALPRLEEVLWLNRRHLVEREVRARGLRSRVVASSGRGGRWD